MTTDDTGPTAEAAVLTVPGDGVVVLDVDDTLYLERSYVRSGFSSVGAFVASDWGVAGVGETLLAGFEAGVRGDAFDRALTAHGIEPTPERVTILVEHYRRHRPEIELLADAARLRDRLGERRVGVITDGPAPSQWAKIGALGLVDWVDEIVVTADLGPGCSKPSPRPYQVIEEAVGAEPGRCWYIGDNPAKDFVSPLDRGWQPVRIRRPGSLHEGVPTPAGVREISSLDQLTL